MSNKWIYFLVCLLPTVCAANALNELKAPTVDYKADLIMNLDGIALEGTLYSTPNRQRFDMILAGMEMVALIDPKQKRVITWRREAPIPFELPFAASGFNEQDNYDQIEMVKIGTEEVNAIITDKYRVSGAMNDGARVNGHLWVGPENIPVKMVGAYTAVGSEPQDGMMEVSNLDIGPLDPVLFALPTGGGLQLDKLLEGLMGQMPSSSKQGPSPAPTDMNSLLEGLLGGLNNSQ